MNTKDGFQELISDLITFRIRVYDAYHKASHMLQMSGITCPDIYDSIDLLFKASLPVSRMNPSFSSAIIKDIPESMSHISDNSALRDSAANIVRLTSGKNNTSHTAAKLRYWTGTTLSVFYDPIMIGFASQNELCELGWGSERIGAYIASNHSKSGNAVELALNRVAVVLTRHQSKYAHFVRDRLTKVIWAQYQSGLGPFDEFIFDYPLSQSELACLYDLGIRARYIYASNIGRLFHIHAKSILVIEVSSGMSLLPMLKEILGRRQSVTSQSKKIFLSRGTQGQRRNAKNFFAVEEVMQDLGYSTVDLSKLGYLDQLTYCSSATITCGFHGAQLINALTTRSLIEIHSYPYCASEWSETMLKMANVLDIPYVPLLLTTINEDGIEENYEDKTIHDIHNALKNLKPDQSFGQKAEFSVNLDNLVKAILTSESLLNKF